MEKTPIETIILEIENMIEARKYKGEPITDLLIMKNVCILRLEAEKKVIVDAHQAGQLVIFANGIEDAEQYYTDKFNQGE